MLKYKKDKKTLLMFLFNLVGLKQIKTEINLKFVNVLNTVFEFISTKECILKLFCFIFAC